MEWIVSNRSLSKAECIERLQELPVPHYYASNRVSMYTAGISHAVFISNRKCVKALLELGANPMVRPRTEKVYETLNMGYSYQYSKSAIYVSMKFPRDRDISILTDILEADRKHKYPGREREIRACLDLSVKMFSPDITGRILKYASDILTSEELVEYSKSDPQFLNYLPWSPQYHHAHQKHVKDVVDTSLTIRCIKGTVLHYMPVEIMFEIFQWLQN